MHFAASRVAPPNPPATTPSPVAIPFIDPEAAERQRIERLRPEREHERRIVELKAAFKKAKRESFSDGFERGFDGGFKDGYREGVLWGKVCGVVITLLIAAGIMVLAMTLQGATP